MLSGQRVGKYTVHELIGQGGMSHVYRGVQHGPGGFERPVAIKVLRAAAGQGDADPFFAREARTVARLQHPNIAQVLEFFTENESHLLVMELVDGITLARLMRREKELPRWIRAGVAVELGRALQFAHELTDEAGQPLGIVHRDVKPSNVLIGRHGEVKLSDFGLAKASMVHADQFTAEGVIKGTPRYMSPEQREGRKVGPASDIYSFGRVVYELCTGTVLPEANPEPSRLETFDSRLTELVRRALSDKVSRRPAAREMVETLQAIRRDVTPPEQVAGLADELAALVERLVPDKEPETPGEAIVDARWLRDMSTAPNTDVVDGGTTRDETGTARDEGTVAVTQSPVSRSRSVLVGVALSSAAVILVVVGLWIGLGSSGSESDESPGAGVNAGASDLAVLLTRVSQAVGSEQWDEAIKTCARLTGDAKTNAEANCAKARMEKEASGHFEAEHRASLRNEYEEVLLEHAKIPRESVYKKRDLHVVENARFKYMPQAMRILDDLVEAGDCEQARRVAGRIKELDPSNTDAEQKVARCGVAGAWPETEQPAAPTVAQIQQAKTLLKQARTSYVAGKHAYSIQQAKQVLKLVPGNPDAIQIVGAASCYLKQAGQAKWAYDRLRPAVRNLVRNICIRNGINLE